MDGDDRKEELIVKIHEAADRHLDFPRNGSEKCARTLMAVAQSLEQMPTDAQPFVRYWNAWYPLGANDREISYRIDEQIQVENNFVRNYGLNAAASEDGRDFLSELTKRLLEVRDRAT